MVILLHFTITSHVLVILPLLELVLSVLCLSDMQVKFFGEIFGYIQTTGKQCTVTDYVCKKFLQHSENDFQAST